MEGGLVVLERMVLPDHQLDGELPLFEGENAKLAIYCGRAEEREGRLVIRSVLSLLREAGVPGATVLAGLDGTIGGERRRARFFARNQGVPAIVLSVGARERYAALLPRLRGALNGRHVMTLEKVHVVRHDGRTIGDLPAMPDRDARGFAMWQRVSVFAGEMERWEGKPLHSQLIRHLREANAAGATVLRGVTGYSLDRPVHTDRLLAIRRRAPILVTMIDSASAIVRLWPIVARATAAAGLVTCEVVPAFRTLGPSGTTGGLTLADPPA